MNRVIQRTVADAENRRNFLRQTCCAAAGLGLNCWTVRPNDRPATSPGFRWSGSDW